MRNIRKVNVINFTSGTGDSSVFCEEVYESDATAAGRMNELMNRNVNAECSELYEVGANLGTFAGTLFSTLEVATRVAEREYGIAVL